MNGFEKKHKVGRNDPCPCGSGRKFKKCHGDTRVIFIEVNMSHDHDEHKAKQVLGAAIGSIRAAEERLKIDGQPAPPAYVIATNNPHQYDLNGRCQTSAAAEGFKIPDFKADTCFTSLREALRAREKHSEMDSLIKSMKSHHRIPSTFDGEIPELAFGQADARLQVGEKYRVLDEKGNEVVGELLDASVMESRRTACCVMKDFEGRNFISECPLSKDELAAYRKHPDTFFGVHKPHTKKIEDPLELLDSFLTNYGNASKETLLGFMKGAPDYDALKEMPQKDLAEICCERWVYDLMRGGCFANASVNPLEGLLPENRPTASISSK